MQTAEAIIYVAGNPRLYPLEYYDVGSGTYEGAIPDFLGRFAAEYGYDLRYFEPQEADSRRDLAANLQVDLISGVQSGESYPNTAGEPLLLFEAGAGGAGDGLSAALHRRRAGELPRAAEGVRRAHIPGRVDRGAAGVRRRAPAGRLCSRLAVLGRLPGGGGAGRRPVYRAVAAAPRAQSHCPAALHRPGDRPRHGGRAGAGLFPSAAGPEPPVLLSPVLLPGSGPRRLHVGPGAGGRPAAARRADAEGRVRRGRRPCPLRLRGPAGPQALSGQRRGRELGPRRAGGHPRLSLRRRAPGGRRHLRGSLPPVSRVSGLLPGHVPRSPVRPGRPAPEGPLPHVLHGAVPSLPGALAAALRLRPRPGARRVPALSAVFRQRLQFPRGGRRGPLPLETPPSWVCSARTATSRCWRRTAA